MRSLGNEENALVSICSRGRRAQSTPASGAAGHAVRPRRLQMGCTSPLSVLLLEPSLLLRIFHLEVCREIYWRNPSELARPLSEKGCKSSCAVCPEKKCWKPRLCFVSYRPLEQGLGGVQALSARENQSRQRYAPENKRKKQRPVIRIQSRRSPGSENRALSVCWGLFRCWQYLQLSSSQEGAVGSLNEPCTCISRPALMFTAGCLSVGCAVSCLYRKGSVTMGCIDTSLLLEGRCPRDVPEHHHRGSPTIGYVEHGALSPGSESRPRFCSTSPMRTFLRASI